jgi:UPF0755 protein
MLRALGIFLFLLIATAAAAGAGYVWFLGEVAAPGPLAQQTTVIIAPGTGVSAIARQLTESRVIAKPWMMTLEARRSGQDRLLKPGEYRFDPAMSVSAVINKIVRHDVVARFVTIPEGLTTADIKRILAGAEGLVGDVTVEAADGDLLPETYRYEWGDKRDVLIGHMRAARDTLVRGLWDTRAADLPLSGPEEAVTLASIVEKETGVASERPHVAAVFLNRLRKGMKLQSDPTVAYGVAGAKAATLTYADLERPTPFNTYVIPGLPPSPICHPGRAALQAVLNPIASDDLYFVADGSGGHAFAATLEEHNRNVARWRQIQRQKNTAPK